MGNEIFRITDDVLDPEVLARWVYPNLDLDMFWSDEWQPSFYVALAEAGFISVCHVFEGQCLLLPQLHKAYAVLDWIDRRPSRSVKRLVESGHVVGSRAHLIFRTGTDNVADGITRAYGSDCWLHPEYRDMLRRLEALHISGFRLFGVELRSGDGDLIGGELGYTIGRTYTSLTGFFERSLGTWNNYGKLQLHALAAVLQAQGYAFWNLGQPQMQYKIDLGARVCPRGEFIPRWLAACGEAPHGELESLLDRRISCEALAALLPGG